MASFATRSKTKCGKRVFESHNTKICRAQMPAQLAIQVPGDTFRPQRRLWPPNVQHVMSRFHACSMSSMSCLPWFSGGNLQQSCGFPGFPSSLQTSKNQTDCSLDDQSECFVKALIPATKHPSNGSYQGFMNGSSLGFLTIFGGAPAIEVLGKIFGRPG